MKTASLTGMQQQKYLRLPIVLLWLRNSLVWRGVSVRQKFVRGECLRVPGDEGTGDEGRRRRGEGTDNSSMSAAALVLFAFQGGVPPHRRRMSPSPAAVRTDAHKIYPSLDNTLEQLYRLSLPGLSSVAAHTGASQAKGVLATQHRASWQIISTVRTHYDILGLLRPSQTEWS